MASHSLAKASKRHFFILLVSYVVIVFLGGIIFLTIEEDCEVESEEILIERKLDDYEYSHSLCKELEYLIELDLINNNTELAVLQKVLKIRRICSIFVDLNQTSLPHMDDLKLNKSEIVDSLDVLNSTQRNCLKWTYLNVIKWVTFSSSTVFTIGYGDVAPKTLYGRGTMIIYSMLGMPVALSLLAVASEMIIHNLSVVIIFFESKLLRRDIVKHPYLKISFAALISFVISIVCGCIVSTSNKQDNMTWIVAIYFWF